MKKERNRKPNKKHRRALYLAALPLRRQKKCTMIAGSIMRFPDLFSKEIKLHCGIVPRAKRASMRRDWLRLSRLLIRMVRLEFLVWQPI